MHCPYCQAIETKVVDSRLVADGEQVRRRRECLSCALRFTTYETIELSLPRLIKSDGSYVQFKEDKLKAGMLKALEKRPVSTVQLDAAIKKIIFKLRDYTEKEMKTHKLGEWVMEELKLLDQVAYIRFASVYRQFEAVAEFEKEIARLKEPEQ